MSASLAMTEIWAPPGASVEEDLKAFGFRQSIAPSGSAIFSSHSSVLAVTVADRDEHREFLSAHDYGVACLWLDGLDAQEATQRIAAAGKDIEQIPHPYSGTLRPSFKVFGNVRLGIAHPADSMPGVEATEQIEATDHFAVCVQRGRLQEVCELLEQTLDFRDIFRETIEVGEQSMVSRVEQSPDATITFTIIEPGPGPAGQISQFLANNGGEGIQHIAFRVPNAVRAVDDIAKAGVEFLSTPHAYYEGLNQHAEYRHRISDLEERGLLVDTDHDGALFQVFTRSTHPQGTLFYEVIERDGARTFGSGNIRALYEAVRRSES